MYIYTYSLHLHFEGSVGSNYIVCSKLKIPNFEHIELELKFNFSVLQSFYKHKMQTQKPELWTKFWKGSVEVRTFLEVWEESSLICERNRWFGKFEVWIWPMFGPNSGKLLGFDVCKMIEIQEFPTLIFFFPKNLGSNQH